MNISAILRSCYLGAWRALKWSLISLVVYLLVIAIGLIPVNNDFKPAEHGIEIFVISDEVHADIVVPVTTDEIDWSKEFDASCFPSDTTHLSHVAIGWGDRGFFLETPTWADLKVSTAAKAMLWPSSSCMHVNYTKPEYLGTAVSVTISEDQYRQLIEFIRSSMKRSSDGEYIHIPGESYNSSDAFFEAQGSYHLFNTCNSWAGRGLCTAEVRTPWQSSWPKTPMLYLPVEGE